MRLVLNQGRCRNTVGNTVCRADKTGVTDARSKNETGSAGHQKGNVVHHQEAA